MTDLLDELYRFAEETRVMRQLDCLREYRHISRQREQRLLWLRENLPEAAKAVLQELEGIDLAVRAAYEKAVFRTGLAMGAELSHL